jgi:hypothetical protein
LEQYKRETSAGDAMEEFDSSREVVQSLISEYVACESPNYLDWKAPSSFEEDVRQPGRFAHSDFSAVAE